MLRKFKINEHGQKYLNDRPSVKKLLLDNKIISEYSGLYYIIKGDPGRCVRLYIKYDNISRRVEITKEGFVYAQFINGNNRIMYCIPISYNPFFTEKVFSTYSIGDVVKCYEDNQNKLKVKGTPNLLSVLVYDSNLREISIDSIVKEWAEIVKYLEELEGTYRQWC